MPIPRGSRGARRSAPRPDLATAVAQPPPKARWKTGAHPFATALKRVPTAPGAPTAPQPRATRGPRSDSDEPMATALAPREREQPHKRRGRDGSELDPAAFEPFRATPVLQPMLEPSAPAAGSGLERAQAVAMAERLLHSVRVGKVAGGHEVRLTLAGARVEVRLRQQGESLVPELHLGEGASAADWAAADRLAARLDTELRGAGLEFESIAIVR